MNDQVQQLSGGGLRFQAGAPTESTTYQQPEANRVNPGGAVRFTAGQAGEGEQFGGVARHNTFHDAPAAGSSIMATQRRDAMGVSVETRPGDPTSRTLIQSALREGLVHEVAPGVFVDTVTGKSASGADQGKDGDNGADTDTDKPADPGTGVFDAREDAIWTEAIAPLPQGAYDAATARSIAAAISGGDFDSIGLDLAKEAGIEPALANEYIGAGVEMHQRIADRELGKLGLSGEDLQAAYGWMRSSRDVALRHCLQQFVMGRDIGPLRKLAGEYQLEQKRKAG